MSYQLKLPNGEVAPKGGIDLIIKTRNALTNQYNWGETYPRIEEGSHSNIDITLKKAGVILSGKVKLPDEDVAPKGGVGLVFRLENAITGESRDVDVLKRN